MTNYKRILGIAIGYSLFNLMALHVVYPIIYRQNPIAKTLNEVKKHKAVFAYKMYNPGYNFYLDSAIKKYSSPETLQAALINNPGAIVISRQDDAKEIQHLNLKLVAQHHDLFELPTTVLYVSKP
jgi:hypothetical protein